jgi:hypothetical protein
LSSNGVNLCVVRHFMRPRILISLLFSLSACEQAKDSISLWKSDHRQVHFEYNSPWTLLPTLDTKAKTLTGVIDYRDGKSYIIQITDDIPLTQLDNKSYYEGAKKTMLQANANNRLLIEDSILFHGNVAHRQVFLMNTVKWGLLKQISLVRRTGIEFISVQINFPITENNSLTDSIPDQIIQFDKKAKLLEK